MAVSPSTEDKISTFEDKAEGLSGSNVDNSSNDASVAETGENSAKNEPELQKSTLSDVERVQAACNVAKQGFQSDVKAAVGLVQVIWQ